MGAPGSGEMACVGEWVVGDGRQMRRKDARHL